MRTAALDSIRRTVPEIKGLGRTLKQWRGPILAWHTTGASNGPTEGLNSIIKKIKRISVYRCSLVSLRRVRAVGVGVGFT